MPVEGKGFSEFVNNAHLPYWYKRVRRKSSQTDFSVEVLPIKDAEFNSQTTHMCPACEANLNLYTVYGIKIEGCPECKGVFLDRDELRKLKDKSERGSWTTLRWMDDEVESIGKVNAMPSKRLCPKCKNEKLISTSFGDSTIIIDWCPNCRGTWLDRGEFQEIVDHLKDKLIKLSSAEMRSRLYEEINEVWGGPEDKISEIFDAKAAISALVNITIFEHPLLSRLLLKFGKRARSIGL